MFQAFKVRTGRQEKGCTSQFKAYKNRALDYRKGFGKFALFGTTIASLLFNSCAPVYYLSLTPPKPMVTKMDESQRREKVVQLEKRDEKIKGYGEYATKVLGKDNINKYEFGYDGVRGIFVKNANVCKAAALIAIQERIVDKLDLGVFGDRGQARKLLLSALNSCSEGGLFSLYAGDLGGYLMQRFKDAVDPLEELKMFKTSVLEGVADIETDPNRPAGGMPLSFKIISSSDLLALGMMVLNPGEMTAREMIEYDRIVRGLFKGRRTVSFESAVKTIDDITGVLPVSLPTSSSVGSKEPSGITHNKKMYFVFPNGSVPNISYTGTDNPAFKALALYILTISGIASTTSHDRTNNAVRIVAHLNWWVNKFISTDLKNLYNARPEKTSRFIYPEDILIAESGVCIDTAHLLRSLCWSVDIPVNVIAFCMVGPNNEVPPGHAVVLFDSNGKFIFDPGMPNASYVPVRNYLELYAKGMADNTSSRGKPFLPKSGVIVPELPREELSPQLADILEKNRDTFYAVVPFMEKLENKGRIREFGIKWRGGNPEVTIR
jgi:hypothetical protein